MDTCLTGKMTLFSKSAIAAAALGAFLLVGGTPRALADDNACRRRIEKADHHLHEAAEHHGWNSPQAARARQQLQEARGFCWERNHHRWWDEDAHRWREDRWDDRDHEHARDHDHDNH